jgi:hypothetical protein
VLAAAFAERSSLRDRLQVLKRRCIEANGPRITLSFLSRLLFTLISHQFTLMRQINSLLGL